MRASPKPRRMPHRAVSALTWTTSAAALALTVHSLVNVRLLRRPPVAPPTPSERVSVLLPVRDEAHQIAHTLPALLAAVQRCGPLAELLVLDDGSQDGTAEVIRRLLPQGEGHRVRLLTGVARPPGWLGKPWACQQLAEQADPASTLLIFVDADVKLAPDGLCASLALLRGSGLDIVCPYPRQLAATISERLVQPLLQWSWLTTLPLRVAERSPRPSLTAGNGQLLVVDRARYQLAGGHETVRGAVLDDVALVRAIKAAGGRGGVSDGTDLATCRMYCGWCELGAGYTKSLWSAFGSPTAAVATVAGLCLVYCWPPIAALTGSRVGLAGYAAAVAGRVATGRRTGARVFPDAAAHPASVAAFGWLVLRSVVGHRRGTLRWKGRPVEVRPRGLPLGSQGGSGRGGRCRDGWAGGRRPTRGPGPCRHDLRAVR